MIHNHAPFPKVHKHWGQKDQEDQFAVDGSHHVFSMMHSYVLSYFSASPEPRSIIKHQAFNGTQCPFSELVTSYSHQLTPNQVLLAPFLALICLLLAFYHFTAPFSCQAPAFLFSQSPTLLALVVPSKQLPRGIPRGPPPTRGKEGVRGKNCGRG